MIFFLVFLGLFVFGNNDAKADTCFRLDNVTTGTDAAGKEITVDGKKLGRVLDKFSKTTAESCYSFCKSGGYTTFPDTSKQYCYFASGDIEKRLLQENSKSGKIGTTSDPYSAGGCSADPRTWVLCLLTPVLWVVKIIFIGSITFLGWVTKTDNLALVLNGGSPGNGVVYTTWVLVRDLLNTVFILILLFSAFATIFQIDKYNYKKILLTLVIMALLVNFSYPIARFIIDISNVLMYSLINSLFTSVDSNSFFTTAIAKESTIQNLFNPGRYSGEGVMLLAIIFLFMLAVTIFAFAILLFIRMVVLAILIIFSPIGFVGNVMPGFQNFASQWWENLFRYSFFGPIMMLGFHICLEMMKQIQTLGSFESMASQVSQNTDPNIIGTVAFMFVPLILLWLTMGLAQKMSIEGAGAVMGKAQKFAKGTGKGLWNATRVPGTFKKFSDDFKKTGKIFGGRPLKYIGLGGSEGRERDEKLLSGFLSGGAEGFRDARTEDRRKKIQDKLDEWKKQGGAEEGDLLKTLSDSKEALHLRQAAAIELSDKHGFKGENAFTNYSKAREIMAGDKVFEKALNDNTKKKRLDLILSYDMKNPPAGKTPIRVAEERFAGFDAADFGKVNFKDLFTNSSLSEDVARNYFASISEERRNEILKKLNAENESFLEGKQFFKRNNSQRKAGFV